MDNEDDNPNGYGSLGGAGVESHNSTHSKIVTEGVSYLIPCDSCSRELTILVPWDELIFMSAGVLPTNNTWIHNAQAGCFMPNALCACQRSRIRLGVTPDECTKNLRSGIAARKISPQDISTFKQKFGLP